MLTDECKLMRTKEETIQGTRVVWLEGDRLDAASVELLRQTLLPTVESGSELRMQVRNVLFADSSGLGLLMELRARAGRDRFGIIEMNDRLMRCLQRIPIECRPQVFDANLQFVPAPWDEPMDLETEPDEGEATEGEATEGEATEGEATETEATVTEAIATIEGELAELAENDSGSEPLDELAGSREPEQASAEMQNNVAAKAEDSEFQHDNVEATA